MGWVRLAESGRWQARWRDPAGRERVKTFMLKTAARDHLKVVESGKITGTYRDPRLGREPLQSFWDRWRARAEELGRPSERTLISYDETWARYIDPVLDRRPLNSITRKDVEDLVAAAAETSAWQAHDALKVLRMLLNKAVTEDLLLRNPAAGVTPPRIDQDEPWVLDPDQVNDLADAVGDRWGALVLLGVYGMLRWSELIALRVDRLDLMRRRVRVEEKITEYGRLIQGEPKTRKARRSITLPEFVALELAEHIRRYPPGKDGLIFTAVRGGPVRRPHFYRLVWKPATTKAGIAGFPVKNLRHTGASLAIAAGANPLLVAARLGHTSTRMVEKHYASLFEGLDREIAADLGRMHEDRSTEARRLRSLP